MHKRAQRFKRDILLDLFLYFKGNSKIRFLYSNQKKRKAEKSMKRRFGVKSAFGTLQLAALTLLWTMAVFSGCTQAHTKPQHGSSTNMLTVGVQANMFDEAVRIFEQPFELIHSDRDLKFIPLYDIQSEGSKVDVFIASEKLMRQLAAGNRLASLHNAIPIEPEALDSNAENAYRKMREIDGGEELVYAPAYELKALAFHKEIFDELRIPYPKEGIEWEQFAEIDRSIMERVESSFSGEFPVGLSGSNGREALEDITTGKAAMAIISLEDYQRLDADIWGIVTLPHTLDVKYLIGVDKSTKRVKEAEHFLAFVSSRQWSDWYVKVGGGLPFIHASDREGEQR